MKYQITAKTILIVSMVSVVLFSCKKEWLDAKPDKSLVVPSSIADYQALLDNADIFSTNDCTLNEIGTNDYYVNDFTLGSLVAPERTAYSWQSDIFESSTEVFGDWWLPYQRIFQANIVLEGIEKITPKTSNEVSSWNNVKGAALFYRAFNHYQIAKAYCKPYEKSTADNDLGIPLRLESDVNIISVRSSVQQTYTSIINDLKGALALLPIPTPINQLYRARPTKAAANAMLARVYLAMNDFDNAYVYANGCLQLYNTLIDYNQVPNLKTLTNPFVRLNDEVLFHMQASNAQIISFQNLIVDSTLFASYDTSDWRKEGFFRFTSNKYTIKGSYSGGPSRFTGLATDEVYLIRAECNARRNNKVAALTDLNALMVKRWKNNGTWVPYDAPDAMAALSIILKERRKELCFRGLRWADLRRLNKEQQFAVTLKRTINNGQTTYFLPPNDIKYVLPIPPGVILLSGMQQNPR